jgi:hypothetical protein
MIKKRSLWILIFLSASALTILFINQAFLNEYIFEPITKLVWLFFHVLQSIDQKIYWGFLIIFAVIIMLFLFPENSDKHVQTAYQKLPFLDDRLSYWIKLFKSAEGNFEYRLKLQSNLYEIIRLVHEIVNMGSEEKNPNLSEIVPTLPKKTHKFFKVFYFSRIKLKKKYEISVNEIINTLEKDLEINHD